MGLLWNKDTKPNTVLYRIRIRVTQKGRIRIRNTASETGFSVLNLDFQL